MHQTLFIVDAFFKGNHGLSPTNTIYIIYFKPQLGGPGTPEGYWFGISPEGIGTLGMIINFAVSFIVSRFTQGTPIEVQDLTESIRYPSSEVKE